MQAYFLSFFGEAASFLHRPIFKYFFVALMALVVDFSVMFFLARVIETRPIYAIAAGFLSGAVINYLLSVLWVFNDRKYRNSKRFEFFLFLAIGFIGLGITELVCHVFFKVLQQPLELAKSIAAGTTFFFNYCTRKLILFTKSEN